MADATAAPPPPPLLDARSAGDILRRSLVLLVAGLPALLVAGLLLLSFRSALLAGTLRLSAVADQDPAVRSLLHRLSSTSPSSVAAPSPLPRRRPPFLHFTRVGTLDDDFFSDPDDFSSPAGRRRSLLRWPPNSSFTAPLFLSRNPDLNSPRNPKIRVPDGFSASTFLFSFPEADADAADQNQSVELRIFGRGIDLDRQDAILIFYLLTLLSSTHSLAILGFIFTYTAALGIVFFSAAVLLLGKPASITGVVISGVKLGLPRLMGFVFLRWAVRDTVAQFLCIWFFSEVQDQGELFKLFVKVKLMPFSLSPWNPWSGPRDEALSELFFVWVMLDTAMSVVFVVVPWVVIMDHSFRRRGRDLIREGCYLISLMPSQAIWIKFFETVVCGILGRWVAQMIGGRLFAAVFHSVAEVYFMVAWLVFYFVARCKDGELEGRRFGHRELEDCLNSLR